MEHVEKDDGEALYEAKEKFWQNFKWLVRETLDEVPDRLERNLRYMIQDSTSCWHPGIPERGERRLPTPSILAALERARRFVARHDLTDGDRDEVLEEITAAQSVAARVSPPVEPVCAECGRPLTTHCLKCWEDDLYDPNKEI